MSWILFVLGCRTEVAYEGTLVGNAGSGKGKLAITTGVNCEQPVIPVTQLNYLSEGGGVEATDTLSGIDLMKDGLSLRTGTFSSVQIQMDNWQLDCMKGQAPITFSFVEPLVTFNLQAEILPSTYILMLGDSEWLEDPRPEVRLQAFSSMWTDVNANGEIDTEDSLITAVDSEHTDDTGHVEEGHEDIGEPTDTGSDPNETGDTGNVEDTADTDDSGTEDSGTEDSGS